LKIANSGGGALAKHLDSFFSAIGIQLLVGYGLTETSPVLTCRRPWANRSGSCGRPLLGTELRIVDADSREILGERPILNWGEKGLVLARGPQVMAGYWQRPDETAKAMTANGFFRTGDIGVMDKRGYFRIIDRKKDMILVSGFNVYPNEIEDVLSQLPGVVECAAVGIPDQKTGEAVKVVIVRKSPALTEAEVQAWCEANLTGYKRPRLIEFRSDLPKSTVGKILRRELREAMR
jgi:long-chain acyl-CoA synthetase